MNRLKYLFAFNVINAGCSIGDDRRDARALFEHTLASSTAAECTRAEVECNLASTAASGTSAPCKLASGETKKKKRHVDAQDCMDNLFGGMMSEASMMANAIKSISSANLESPTKKRQRQNKSITKNLIMLYQEKKMLMDMGLATEDVDKRIKKLLQEHSSI